MQPDCEDQEAPETQDRTLSPKKIGDLRRILEFMTHPDLQTGSLSLLSMVGDFVSEAGHGTIFGEYTRSYQLVRYCKKNIHEYAFFIEEYMHEKTNGAPESRYSKLQLEQVVLKNWKKKYQVMKGLVDICAPLSTGDIATLWQTGPLTQYREKHSHNVPSLFLSRAGAHELIHEDGGIFAGTDTSWRKELLPPVLKCMQLLKSLMEDDYKPTINNAAASLKPTSSIADILAFGAFNEIAESLRKGVAKCVANLLKKTLEPEKTEPEKKTEEKAVDDGIKVDENPVTKAKVAVDEEVKELLQGMCRFLVRGSTLTATMPEVAKIEAWKAASEQTRLWFGSPLLTNDCDTAIVNGKKKEGGVPVKRLSSAPFQSPTTWNMEQTKDVADTFKATAKSCDVLLHSDGKQKACLKHLEKAFPSYDKCWKTNDEVTVIYKESDQQERRQKVERGKSKCKETFLRISYKQLLQEVTVRRHIPNCSTTASDEMTNVPMQEVNMLPRTTCADKKQILVNMDKAPVGCEGLKLQNNDKCILFHHEYSINHLTQMFEDSDVKSYYYDTLTCSARAASNSSGRWAKDLR